MRFVNANNSFAVIEQKQEEPEPIQEEMAEVEEDIPEFVITTDKVKIRAEASTECDVLGMAETGERFELIEEVDGWSKIKYDDQEAYIKSDFVEKTTQLEDSYVEDYTTDEGIY